jgi:nucleoside-diphosphate-sugar epimerase
MSLITVLGASGFVGSHLVARLRELGLAHFAPHRNEDLKGKPLGHVIYCIGLTADFRWRSSDTVEAHVCKLLSILTECEFDSLLYLSSARLYRRQKGIALEDDPVQINPLQSDHVYNVSKAMGESLSLSCGRPGRVVRLSAVYGADFASENFLTTILRDAILTKKVVLQTSLDSDRDYISVDDVVELLIKIATGGRERIYNLASGMNVSSLDLTKKVSELTGCQVETIDNAPKISFPTINTDRIRKEFGFQPASVLADMKRLVQLYEGQTALEAKNQ